MGTTTTFTATRLIAAPVSASTSRWLTYGTILVADLVALFAAGAVAVFTRYFFGAQFTPGDYLTFIPSLLLFVVVFIFCDLYPGVACSPIEEFRLILRASSIGILLIIASTVFLRAGLLSSRIVLALAWVLAIIFVPLCRRAMRGYCSPQSWWGIPTVIFGEHEAALMMLHLLQGHGRLGLRPVALLTDVPISSAAALTTQDVVLGDLADARVVGKSCPGAYAVLAMPRAGSDRIREVLNENAGSYRNVLLVPDLFGMRSLSVSARDICGVLTLQLDQKLAHLIPRALKRLFDFTLAAAAMLLLSPFFAIICLLVAFSSKGHIFYSQPRIGKHGKPIKVLKFRSMVMNADAVLQAHLAADPELMEEWLRDHKLKKDPRITAIGRLLRKLSLDELPQLWNVLAGDMSLVGPRPIVNSEIHKYGASFQAYQLVAPGLTGLWQISGRNNTSYDLRVRIDNYYVRNWSLSLDVYILLRTVKTVLFSEGAY